MYCTNIIHYMWKMALDNLTNQSVATNLEFLDNVKTFLHLVHMVPFMNVVKT
jgi:hypothetical protein